MLELLYTRGTRSADEIQADIDKFWVDLESSEQLRGDVEQAGIDLAAVRALASGESIQVGVRGAGVDPVTVALVVAFAPAANAVLTSLWQQVLLPRIRHRHGRDAIRDEKPPQA